MTTPTILACFHCFIQVTFSFWKRKSPSRGIIGQLNQSQMRNDTQSSLTLLLYSFREWKKQKSHYYGALLNGCTVIGFWCRRKLMAKTWTNRIHSRTTPVHCIDAFDSTGRPSRVNIFLLFFGGFVFQNPMGRLDDCCVWKDSSIFFFSSMLHTHRWKLGGGYRIWGWRVKRGKAERRIRFRTKYTCCRTKFDGKLVVYV